MDLSLVKPGPEGKPDCHAGPPGTGWGMAQDDSRPGAVSPDEMARARALLETPRRRDGAWAALAAAAFAAATALALAAAVILAPTP